MMIGRVVGRTEGSTTVELAIVAPLLIFLLFGIIEFGLMVRVLVDVSHGAREGARSASVGATPETLHARVLGAVSGIGSDRLEITAEYRSFEDSTGTWTNWTTLGSSNGHNDARPGDQIRVGVSYPHQLATGGLFSGLADDPETGTITLRTSTVMQRE